MYITSDGFWEREREKLDNGMVRYSSSEGYEYLFKSDDKGRRVYSKSTGGSCDDYEEVVEYLAGSNDKTLEKNLVTGYEKHWEYNERGYLIKKWDTKGNYTKYVLDDKGSTLAKTKHWVY